jgi:SAM-dependent methyltransferase
MRWKIKSLIQNAVSMLPSSASYSVYYWIQRNLGALRSLEPIIGLDAGINIWKRIIKQEYDPVNKDFFEIGTGTATVIPLAYWLMGARQVVTVDLNPYLKIEIIKEHLRYIKNNKEKIEQNFGNLLFSRRYNRLLEFIEDPYFSENEFLKLCQIKYIAPCNANDTGIKPQSIDFYTSYTVLEHIPLDELARIIKEGNKILKKNGLFINVIDYSDHFSHSDKSISAINFLQYSDKEWNRYADNRYMYMNRLRHDDYLSLFSSNGHSILDVETNLDKQALDLLSKGLLPLDEKFKKKSMETLSIREASIVSRIKD